MKTQFFQTHFKQIPVEDSFAFCEKAEDEKKKVKGTLIKGYASTPTKDRYDDVVEPAAFAESIQNDYRKNPIILFQHKHDRPIGKATYMSIDEKGLYLEGLIVDPDVESKIQAGILKTFSIGYIPKEWEFQDKDGRVLDPKNSDDREEIWYGQDTVRVIKKLELVENSIVSVPANPDALFDLAKSVKSFFENEKPESLPELKKESIIKSNNNQPIMKKENNLLEKKEEEAQEETQKEETQEETEKEETQESGEQSEQETSEETEKTDSDNEDKPEESKSEESEEDSKPADDETSDGEGGDETSAEESEKESEPEESEEEKALSKFSKNEKAIIKEMMTLENAVVAFETIKELTVMVTDLKAIIKKTPAKKALAYFESDLNGSKKVGVANPTSGAEKEDSKEDDSKKGFKESLMGNAI